MSNTINVTFGDKVYLEYTPDYLNNESLDKIFKGGSRPYLVGGTFNLIRGEDYADDVMKDDSGEPYSIVTEIGHKEGSHYIIPSPVLSDDYSLLVDEKCSDEAKRLLEHYKFGDCIRTLFYIEGKDVCIGRGSDEISPELLKSCLKGFPSTNEIRSYKRMKLEKILSADMDVGTKQTRHFERYYTQKQPTLIDTIVLNKEVEIEKYRSIVEFLKKMMSEMDLYKESDWRDEIIKILPLIFPQYIFFTKECWLGKSRDHGRRVDFAMVDSAGYLDLIEIKKPDLQIFASRVPRNNHVPSNDVVDAIAQIENYVHAVQRNTE